MELITFGAWSVGLPHSALVISEGVLVEENTEQLWFLVLFCDFLFLYLHIELFLLSYCHLPKGFHQQITLFECTFELFISRQSLGIQATTVARSCDKDITMSKHIWDQIRTNDLTIAWA